MTWYAVKDERGRVYRCSGETPLEVCRRVADLHGVTVVAWREDKWLVGLVHPDQVVG